MAHSKVSLVLASAIALPAAAPAPLAAQTLSELLPRLLSESVTMPSTVGTVAGNPHEAHFLPAAAQLRAPYALNGALVTQLASFPFGSSSGGFTYTLDERTGIPQRSSGNFGPAFAERALTLGKGTLSVGLNYQHVSFDRFEGVALDGDARFYLQHNDCCPLQGLDGTPNPAAAVAPSADVNPFFEGDLVQARLTLKAQTDTAVLFANYGVSDRFDLAVAVPFVRVELDASMDSTIIRLATASNPAIHSFGGGGDTRSSRETGTARGLGDVVVRGKLRFLSQPGGGLAAGLDLRLPTGDEANLLGTGATQVKLSLIYSGDYGRLSPHINAGYTLSSGSVSQSAGSYQLGDERPVPIPGAENAYQTVFRGQGPSAVLTESDLQVPDEINYTAGFAITASPRLTLNADVVGRTLRDVRRFGVTSKSYSYRLTTGGPLLTASYDDALDITEDPGNLNLLLGIAGLKLNVARTLLLNASVLFPLTSDGLRPKVTGVFGLDYAF
jgi:hypothetical protein